MSHPLPIVAQTTECGSVDTLIAEMLLKNKTLKELELSSDSISNEGIHKLIYSLAHNTTVQELQTHKFNYSQVKYTAL